MIKNNTKQTLLLKLKYLSYYMYFAYVENNIMLKKEQKNNINRVTIELEELKSNISVLKTKTEKILVCKSCSDIEKATKNYFTELLNIKTRNFLVTTRYSNEREFIKKDENGTFFNFNCMLFTYFNWDVNILQAKFKTGIDAFKQH